MRSKKPVSVADSVAEATGDDLLRPLVDAPLSTPNEWAGVVIGELLAITDDGHTPLVMFPGQPGTAAVRARATVDLHGQHIGRHVTLLFEGADPAKPIIVGVIRGAEGWPLEERPGSVEVDVDGERMLVTARQQLVLRCGKASITLTRAGKVLIEGAYVSSRSSGVNRIKGGAVQIN